jgi:DNA-binding response OmpR family regulator
LRRLLSGLPYQIFTTDSCHSALQCLSWRCPCLIVCERSLRDGTWRDLLGFSRTSPGQPPVIVSSQHPDRNFYAEVLNMGGFDVIARPFKSQEVLHVIQTAYWRITSNRGAGRVIRIRVPE